MAYSNIVIPNNIFTAIHPSIFGKERVSQTTPNGLLQPQYHEDYGYDFFHKTATVFDDGNLKITTQWTETSGNDTLLVTFYAGSTTIGTITWSDLMDSWNFILFAFGIDDNNTSHKVQIARFISFPYDGNTYYNIYDRVGNTPLLSGFNETLLYDTLKNYNRMGIYSANGGGATHIAKRTGLLKDLSSYTSDILLISGGGGGGLIIGEDEPYQGADGGGISGNGHRSANQTTGYAFGQGESAEWNSSGGGGLYGGYATDF